MSTITSNEQEPQKLDVITAAKLALLERGAVVQSNEKPKEKQTPEPIKLTVSKVKDFGGPWTNLGFEADVREDRIAHLATEAAVAANWTQDEIYSMITVRIGDYLYVLQGDVEL